MCGGFDWIGMIVCPKCDARNKSGSTVCRMCATSLAGVQEVSPLRADTAPSSSSGAVQSERTPIEEEAQVQTEGITCPECSTANEVGWSFCQQCGKRLPTSPPAPAFDQTPASLKTVPEPQARIDAVEPNLKTVAEEASAGEKSLKTVSDKSSPVEPEPPAERQSAEPPAMPEESSAPPEEQAPVAGETTTVIIDAPAQMAEEPPPLSEQEPEPPPPMPPLKTEHVHSISGLLCNQCGNVSAVGSTTCANCGAPLTFGKTQVMSSQRAPTRGRLHLVMEGGQPGEIYQLSEDTVIGRSAGDIIFPHDGFMSGKHARVVQRGGTFVLTDEGSRNGTFVRIKGEIELKPGDMILVGKQLFRFEV
jgi:hypothetical protein